MNIKNNIALIVLLAIVSSCAPKYYIYKLQLTKPTVSDELKYEDERLSVALSIQQSEVAFNLKNNSDKPLKIIWDDASFVYNGEAQKIIHKNVKFIDKEKTQAPTVIPPQSFISDFVQPIDAIKFNYNSFSDNSYWSSKPILPIISYYSAKDKKHLERVKKFLGTTVNIYIPMQQDGKLIDYYFEIKVSDIHYQKSKNHTESIF